MKTYTVKIDSVGTVRWYDEKGEYHRENGPAIEYDNGSKMWFKNGKLHRENSPAIENSNGYKEWYRNGELHRENGPAIEYENGDVEYYFNGLLHRIDGPAIEWSSGTKEWYLNGNRVTETEVMRLNETIDIEGTKYTLAQIKAALKSVKS